jgi:hypothetical protein
LSFIFLISVEVLGQSFEVLAQGFEVLIACGVG